MKYGAEGYAIYWHCLELISGGLGYDKIITFDLKHDAEVIGYNLKVDTLKVEEIMRFMVEIGLFEASNNIITCLNLAKYLDKKNTRNSTIHKIIDTAQEKIKLSATKRDKSPTNRDCPRLSRLDIDIDIDIDKKKNIKKKKKKNFKPPSVEEITNHCQERKSEVDPIIFWNFYNSKNWMIGKNKMQSWKSAIVTWERTLERNKPNAEQNAIRSI